MSIIHSAEHESEPPVDKSDRVVIGKLTAPYGVKGWVKLHSYMASRRDIFEINPWWLVSKGRDGALQSYSVESGRPQGKTLVVKFEGVDTRSGAELLGGREIVIHRSQLPDLGPDDYYWRDLTGLAVFSVGGERLGTVERLFETGANDVLVVRPDQQSIDDRERLIPYLYGQVVKSVGVAEQRLVVEWDIDF